MAVHVRPAVAADYPAIEVLAREILAYHVAAIPDIFRDTEPALPQEYFRELLESAAAAILLAEEAGTAVGFAICELRPRHYVSMLVPRTTASVEQIVVTEAMRGHGVGGSLFDACAAWAKGQGAERLVLQVWEFNGDAIAFYERRGMTTINRRMSLPL